MTKANLSGIKNIIFDFGRVLLNINPALTSEALHKLNFKPNNGLEGRKDDDVVGLLESGHITSEEFIDIVLKAVNENTTKEEVINAWNAMLLDFPLSHVDCLKKLKGQYRLFLLSNSNQIHYDYYATAFKEAHGFELQDLFEKMWFSFEIGLIKPDTEIFRYVLSDGALKPEETLFIDDTLVHVEAAAKVGIHTYHLTGSDDICDIF
ncbi:MAG TPA: HAD family phosphatase [Lentimicrobium sp.]|nr:HAD family phosphatase [Lentimicrobium sp.]